MIINARVQITINMYMGNEKKMEYQPETKWHTNENCYCSFHM